MFRPILLSRPSLPPTIKPFTGEQTCLVHPLPYPTSVGSVSRFVRRLTHEKIRALAVFHSPALKASQAVAAPGLERVLEARFQPNLTWGV